jgi:hypothetical protein
VYSQSYFAGIFLIPFLARVVDRDFVAARGAGLRALLWTATIGVLGFVLWWKGGLMVEHDKHLEAAGWLALSAILWVAVSLAEALPARVARTSRRALLRGLARGVSIFFLGMAVLDPLVQIGVHGLDWSTGLIVEVGFFVPAGLALLLLSRWLGRDAPRACAPKRAGTPEASAP